MRSDNYILDYFGNTHASFLHAKGKIATTALMNKLACKSGESILEIGFGTGATLVLLAAAYPQVQFQGIEISELMQQKALARMKFCGLQHRVKLSLMKVKHVLPFPDQHFDKVYLESVLAIQEGRELRDFLVEITRILKPGGHLLVNETLWLQSTSREKITEINSCCLSLFGMIQANADYPYPKDWQNLLRSLGLKVESMEKVDEIKKGLPNCTPLMSSPKSNLFTYWGKLKARFNPRLRKAQKDYQHKMNNGLLTGRQWMEGIIIAATKG